MFKKKLFYINYLILMILVINLFPSSGLSTKKEQPKVKAFSCLKAFYLNDQRLQWSGMEATFGVESDFGFEFEQKFKNSSLKAVSHFFINQAFGENKLRDEARDRYLQNFEIETFSLARLYLELTFNKIKLSMGRRDTVFGKSHSLILSNRYIFQPFIRNEAILRFETGLFCQFSSGIFDLKLAVVNGEMEMDTNSSKSGIVRIGLQGRNWSFGISGKIQDGIGSEQQKYFNNHIGCDLMIKLGKLTLSGEFIYDEYGFRKPFLADDVFWKRSLYYRHIFYKLATPITGLGGYIDLLFETGKLKINLNYGEYYPEEIGNLYHDDPVKRGIAKIMLQLEENFTAFAGILWENERNTEHLFKGASDFAMTIGFLYHLEI